jgi:hypothetical protein
VLPGVGRSRRRPAWGDVFTRSMEAETGALLKSSSNPRCSYADVVQREPHVPRERSCCSSTTTVVRRRKVRFTDSSAVVPFQVGSPPSDLGRVDGLLQPFVSYFQHGDDVRYSTQSSPGFAQSSLLRNSLIVLRSSWLKVSQTISHGSW